MTAGIPIALTIAGSDSSGGAGIQADLKTFSALGVYGASVITALTAQNTQGVRAVHAVPPEVLQAQLAAVFDDLEIAAVKIGMVGAGASVEAIAAALDRASDVPVILDPVMVAGTGDPLLEAGAERALREYLLPMADLLTPNLQESARLLRCPVAADAQEMQAQARALQELGPRAVLLKGGHAQGAEALDILFDGTGFVPLAAPWIDTANTHGTGCTLASAIAACMAHGAGLRDAVARAKAFVTGALQHADALDVGQGSGPVHHFHALWRGLD